MDDLIASLGGSMHVSQEGYDLKALQEYLAQTMVRPSLPLSPNPAFRPIPPSRSVSSTRKPSSLPGSYTYPDGSMNLNQAYPYPSPISSTFSSYAEEPAMLSGATPTGLQRPGTLRRSSSYGFGCAINVNIAAPSSPSASYSAFETDAFAPLWQQQQQMEAQDPWAKMRSAQQGDAFHQYGYNSTSHVQENAFAGPSQSTGFGAFRPAQGFGLSHQGYPLQMPMGIGGSPPTPPAEDDEEMDEDFIDDEMDEEEEEEDRVERVMGLTSMDGAEGQCADGDDMFGRGRRKF
ncbi:hypothetical protein IAU59_006417 [Kwoniella sp. CBS 9459]